MAIPPPTIFRYLFTRWRALPLGVHNNVKVCVLAGVMGTIMFSLGRKLVKYEKESRCKMEKYRSKLEECEKELRRMG